MIQMDVEINPSFYKKVNHEILKKCESLVIKKTTLEAENRCKKKSPGPGNQLPNTTYKASGHLRRGHSSEITDEEKMPARNYPKQVADELSNERYMSATLTDELKRQGVIE